MTKLPKPPEHVEVFYDRRDGSYWYKITGQYEQLAKTELVQHMIADEHLAEKNFFEGMREVDWPMLNARRNRKLDFAGSLGGHRTGIFTDGSGRKYLVIDEAKGVWDDMPKRPGKPEFFLKFIQELLPEDQWNYLCHWLAVAMRSLRLGDFRPGQALFFVGEARCGKSLLQNIITEILGGRVANPFGFLTGDTNFNKDLCAAEHWQMEDPASTTDPRTRREFGDAIKSCVATRDFYLHQKSKDALVVPVFRRVTCSINNESENIARIPPIDPSMEDKVFLFLCHRVEKAFEEFRMVDGTASLLPETKNNGELDRAAVWRKIKDEIPQVRAWLLASFKNIPKEMRDDRYGIRAWHHPDLLSELSALAPETRLLQLIDQKLWSDDPPHTEWSGKAIELEEQLRDGKFAFETEKVLRFTGACGSYLGKLSKSQAQRVSKRVTDGYTHWKIQPPFTTNGEK